MEIKTHLLAPTALVPNSPRPLLHYKSVFPGQDCDAVKIHDILSRNGWQMQWIYRYGPTQPSHYHSSTHECMVVLSGSATVRFGVADAESDYQSIPHGSADGKEEGKEEGGIELPARKGDVFILPAGIAHKTFNTLPASTFKLLTPGDGHHTAADGVRDALAGVELDGFTMMGAYPKGGVWDFAIGGENSGEYEAVWAVPKPDADPVLGKEPRGLCSLWT